MGPNAFNNCPLLTSICLPAITNLASGVIASTTASGACNKVFEYVELPNCLSVGSGALRSYPKLVGVSLPVCTYMDDTALMDDTTLAALDLPELLTIGNGASTHAFCRSCTGLMSVRLAKCSSFGSRAFYNCARLVTLDLTGVSSVPALASHASTLASTPIKGYSAVAGQYGSVYVPSSLYSAFIAATGWSGISARITSDTPPSFTWLG